MDGTALSEAWPNQSGGGSPIMTERLREIITYELTTSYTVDAKNGPFPQVCEVTRIHGTKTWMVHFKVVTYVNECQNPRERNPLVAHRWTRYEDVDQDYFSVVTTQGVAAFRVDELIRLGKYPDQYRQDLFHAIPKNFKRESVFVEPSSDGCSVTYRIVDRQLAFNIGRLCKWGGCCHSWHGCGPFRRWGRARYWSRRGHAGWFVRLECVHAAQPV